MRSCRGELVYFLMMISYRLLYLTGVCGAFGIRSSRWLGAGPNLVPRSAMLEQLFALVHAAWRHSGQAGRVICSGGCFRESSEKEP